MPKESVNRNASVPYSLIVSMGSTTFPNVLDIFRPWRVHPINSKQNEQHPHKQNSRITNLEQIKHATASILTVRMGSHKQVKFTTNGMNLRWKNTHFGYSFIPLRTVFSANLSQQKKYGMQYNTCIKKTYWKLRNMILHTNLN